MRVFLDRLRLFSFREFVTHKGRTLAAVVVVTVSAAFLVAIFGISGSVTTSVQRLTTGLAGNAALEVSGVSDGGFPQSIRQQVASVPGVAAAVPLLRAQTTTASGSALLLGADASTAALDSDLRSVVQRELGPLLNTADGVLVGPGVGYTKGQSFELGSARVTVADVIPNGPAAELNDGNFVLAPLPLAQRLTNREGQIDSVFVVAKPGTDIAQLSKEITSAVAGRAVVADPSVRTAQTGSGIKLIQYVSLMGAAVAFVVAAFLVYTVMGMAITQRRRTISTLRAVGDRRSALVRDILGEAAVFGIVGGVIGSALGIVMGRVAIGRLPAAVLQTVDAKIIFALPGYAIPVAIALATAASVSAAAMAAHQIYKVSPIEAMVPVGVSSADTVRAWVRVGAAVSAIVLYAAAAVLAAAHLGMPSAAAFALVFAAAVALCFALARPIVGAAARAARMFGSAGQLAAATIERSPRRVWGTLVIVMIAVSTTVGIQGANAQTLQSARESFSALSVPDVWVSSTTPDVYPAGPLLPTDLPNRVAAVPGVSKVTPQQFSYASVRGTKVMLVGAAPGAANPVSGIDEQTTADITAGRGVALSKDFAKSLGVNAGDHISLQTPHGDRSVRVLAVVPFFSILTGTVVVGYNQLQQWFDRPGATALQVKLASGVDTDRVIGEIRQLAPAGVHVYSGAQALDGFSNALAQGMSLAGSVWVIVAIIAAVALLNTLMLSVIERRREIGVIRAMGASRKFTLRMVLVEALGIAIVGAALGVIFGLISQYVQAVASTDVLGFAVSFRLSPTTAVFACVALALSLVGSIPPAVRAARLDITQAVAIE